MVDVQTILEALRAQGHTVTHATPISENAGDYEFVVDGNTLTLAQVRAILESDTGQ